mmetsp:Transcript_6969/g.12318  ORF Transcript_6969/g.12318 Transcript_6969/m.12318 type:complete len:453 (+) Transcript_6969:1-1359(+)
MIIRWAHRCRKLVCHPGKMSFAELAEKLDIDEAKMPGSLPLKRKMGDLDPDAIRVMQWNVLAGGMSQDGFLVADIIDEAKATKMDLGPATDLKQIYEDVKAVKKAGGDLATLQEKFTTPRAEKNLLATVAWDLRWARMKDIIAAAQPSVITFQEMDHMAEVQSDLAKLGYACSVSPDARYAPVHKAALPEGDRKEYLQHLKSVGVAYAPGSSSTCRKIALGRGETNADDDGVGIFWHAAAFEPREIDFHPANKKGCSAVVRASLTRKSDNFQFCVLCAHLKSGDSAEDEAGRITELTVPVSGFSSSTMDWLQESISKSPTLFCLDANSAPTRTDATTVWKTLCSFDGVESVWSDKFSPDGTPKSLPAPVTTNKMRGPLSQQTKKIGEHMCHVIDHIFFSSEFSMIEHAFPPLCYESVDDAAADLLPTLAIPSDHSPVIVDFQCKLSAGIVSL